MFSIDHALRWFWNQRSHETHGTLLIRSLSELDELSHDVATGDDSC